jgi:hypothetical protein
MRIHKLAATAHKAPADHKPTRKTVQSLCPHMLVLGANEGNEDYAVSDYTAFCDLCGEQGHVKEFYSCKKCQEDLCQRCFLHQKKLRKSVLLGSAVQLQRGSVSQVV